MAEDPWIDDDAGRLVRPFALIGGRTTPSRHELDMITLVVAVGSSEQRPADLEYAEILRICAQPLSVAEVAAAADLPMVVVKVLLSDLIDSGEVIFRSPPRATAPADNPLILRAVLDGLHRL